MPYYPQPVPAVSRSFGEPSGRVSLQTGVPIMTADVAGGTQVYLVPYMGNRHVLCDGAALYEAPPLTELSQLLSDTTKSPAAAAANSCYDTFLWNDGGLMRNTRGPAWSSDTVRGTAAALVTINGLAFNNVAISNGPDAAKGTWTGTIRTNAAGTVDWKMGSGAAGGGEARLCVWNQFNRTLVGTNSWDTTAAWAYAANAWRAANNSAGNRVSVVMGANEDIAHATYEILFVAGSTGGYCHTGFGLDSTTALAARQAATRVWPITAHISPIAHFRDYVGLGFHYIQAIELADGTVGGTFYTVSGPQLMMLSAQFRM